MFTPDPHLDKRRRTARFLSHAIVIVILFVLPEVLLNMARPQPGPVPLAMYGKPIILILVFYVNYYLLIPRFLGQKFMTWRFLCANLLLLVAALWVGHLIWQSGIGMGKPHKIDPDRTKFLLRSLSFLIRDGVMIILTVALSAVLRLSEKWLALERRHEAMQAEQRESELQSLRSQLSPHFLFNTLNSIYALITISPEQAQNAVHRLSQLLRYVLYENPEEVTLRQELDFVRNYVELMRLRVGDRPVNLTLDDGEHGDRPLAPLIFVSLIENAFKHGNVRDTSAPISIDIALQGDTLTCRTINTIDSKANVDSHKGIGIANLQRRLDLIYGSKATLDTAIRGDRYIATLTIALSDNDTSKMLRD